MQPVDDLLRAVMTAYTEHFELIMAHQQQALGLISAPDFLRATYPKRGSGVQEILDQCGQPQVARYIGSYLGIAPLF